MDNLALPINQIINRINDAAANNEAIILTAEEVKILSKDVGETYFVPVLTNEQIVQLYEEGKLRKSMLTKKRIIKTANPIQP